MGVGERILIVLGGLAGALGVALSAMAAHVTGGGNLDTAARFLLLHAPALVGIGILSGARLVVSGLALSAGSLMVVGLVLFCGDLSARAIWSIAPFRHAAPLGGFALILAWLTVGLAGLWPRRG